MKNNGYSDQHIIAGTYNVKEKKFWLKKLSGQLPCSGFPYDSRNLAPLENLGKGYHWEKVPFKFHQELLMKLKSVGKGSDYALHIILTAGVVVLLDKYMYGANSDIIVGSPIYKQEQEGEFINTVLPLRIQMASNITFKELLLKVKQTVAEAVEHQNYPIELLTRELDMPVTDHDFPLFDTLILLENIHDKRYIQHRKPNTIFSFSGSGELLKGEMEYNSMRYEKATIVRIARYFTHLLREALFNMDSGVPALDILPPNEKKQLLADFNNTRTPYPGENTIQELFEEQVEKAPDKTALVYQHNCLTYRELNHRANQLARYLRTKGVKPDTIVAIMFDHSLEMIVGILGILKAGGGYLPIDTKLPLKRILSMMEDCQVSILVTGQHIFEKYKFTLLQGHHLNKVVPFLTAPRPQLDFDRLVWPDRSLVSYEKYNRYIGQSLVKNSISLQGSRGCPYKCAYCHKIWPKTHVYRSAENIFAELQLYYNLGVKRFNLIDDIFNLNRENSMAFFKLIIDNHMDLHLFFPNGLRGDILTPDYIDLMVEAGGINIALALETASPRLQKLIHKNLNLEKFHKNAEYLIEKYPQVIVDLFTMHGFPTETEKEALMTLDFIKSLKWVDFPMIWILKIYPNTDMAELAVKNGISPRDIAESEHLAFHQLPKTLPWKAAFTKKYQAEFFNEYFLLKERLLHKLPYQMKVLTEEEIVQQYNSILPNDVYSIKNLLEFAGIKEEELGGNRCQGEDFMYVPNLDEKIKKSFKPNEPDKDALRVLLLDLTLFFTGTKDVFADLHEPPIGLMYLLSYLHQEFGSKVKGKIAKSRVDFDSYDELHQLLVEFKPAVIGIRALNYFSDFFHQLTAVIRQSGITAPIVAGGPYATSSYESLLQDRHVNLAVLGEGEITFSEIIRKMLENRGQLPGNDVLKQIPGIAFVPREPVLEKRFPPSIIIQDAFDWLGPKKDALEEHSRDRDLENLHHSTQLAYVIYTSGSTGEPKGVMVEHRNVIRLVKNNNYIEFKEDDRLLLTGSFAFDITTFEFWAPLLNGITLHLPKKNLLLDAKGLRDYILNNKITILHLIPQLCDHMADQQPEIFAGLNYFLVGGDVVGTGPINRIRNRFKDVKILHMYGPTENTVFSTFLPVDEDYEIGIPIGKPVSNTTVYIVDNNHGLQPLGAAGELCVSGHGLARGYLNRPQLTIEKFVPNPFARHPGVVEGFEPGEVMYKTGDLAKWLPNGNIEFLGRIDQQIKIRGIRIELGEIENVIRRNNAVEDCIVISRKVKEENQIAAYYKKKKKIELWPTMAEYFAYDDVLYHAIAHDEDRNEKYRNAIGKAVKGKIVLEIGPGPDMILSRMCIEAGAEKVYAVEILEDAYKKGKETIKKLKLENKIILIHSDITVVELPQKVDYCVSEIVGTIGGSEGAAKLINSIHKMLHDPSRVIPSRSETLIAAITLPEDEFDGSFEEVGAYYVEKIFQQMGRRFDLRLCLLNFPRKNVISNRDVFEKLDFTRESKLEGEHDIYLEIEKESILNGFIVWLILYCDEENVIDTLEKKYIWLPIYLPIFSKGEAVQKGDTVKAKITRKLSENGVNPDFTVAGTLVKRQANQAIDFIYHLPHRPTDYKKNHFYQQIFTTDKLKITETITPEGIREFLAREVPEYMIPSHLIQLEEMPLTHSGKIDRNALPAPPSLEPGKDWQGPRNEIEQKIAAAWEQVLGVKKIGIHIDFFETGGNSIKAMNVTSLLSNDFDININHIFQYGTIASIAENVKKKKDSLKEKILALKSNLEEAKERAKQKNEQMNTSEHEAQQRQKEAEEEAYQAYIRQIKKEKLPSLEKTRDYQHILLTGATGFLGAHLVYEILDSTRAVLHLPVRANSNEQAEARLKKRLSFYWGETFYEANKKRIQVMRGDLTADRLGIDSSLYHQLSEMVEAVVHSAANVRHFGRYEEFFKDNVQGTEKALEFACTGIKKDFHHISTMGVGYGNIEGKRSFLFTEYCLDFGQKLEDVYDRSKLEAEKLIPGFREKGLNVSIYRMANLVFNSQTGKFQENIKENAFYAFIKAITALGMIPGILTGKIMEFSFIDLAAKIVALLMTRKNLQNQTYHLNNPHLINVKEMVSLINRTGTGINIKVLETGQFLDRLLEYREVDDYGEIIDRLLLHFGFFSEGKKKTTHTSHANERTMQILKQLHFEWPKPNESNLGKMIEYCRQVGFLPLP